MKISLSFSVESTLATKIQALEDKNTILNELFEEYFSENMENVDKEMEELRQKVRENRLKMKKIEQFNAEKRQKDIKRLAFLRSLNKGRSRLEPDVQDELDILEKQYG